MRLRELRLVGDIFFAAQYGAMRSVSQGTGLVVVVGWVRLNLNPAIWEAIAGTGWRLKRPWSSFGFGVSLKLNPHPLTSEGAAPKCRCDLV